MLSRKCPFPEVSDGLYSRPSNTKFCRCSSPIYKVASCLHGLRTPSCVLSPDNFTEYRTKVVQIPAIFCYFRDNKESSRGMSLQTQFFSCNISSLWLGERSGVEGQLCVTCCAQCLCMTEYQWTESKRSGRNHRWWNQQNDSDNSRD